MNELVQGSVVLVDFSYSDRVRSKMRPALIVSNSRYNSISRDVIVVKVTTRKPRMMAAALANADLVTGRLDHPSYVQVDGIYALEKELICDTLGTLKPEKMQEIRDLFSDLFSPDSP